MSNNNNTDSLIAKVMNQFGFRHQYQVAEYFGVTAQTLSGWVKTGIIPDKYLMKFQLDIQDLQKKESISEQSDSKNQKEIVNQNFLKSQSNLNEFSFTVFFANHIRSLIIIPFIFSILSLIFVFFIFRPVYTSSAKILPIGDSGNSFSDMAGMASQLGLSMPMNFGNEIPWDEMFPEIIKSENLVQSILNDKFSSNKYGEKKSLFTIIEKEYNLKNKSVIILEKMVIHEFNEMIKVSKSRLSPIVTIALDFFEPQVAADILEKVIEVAGKTQVKIKLKQISEKRQFIEERIYEVTRALKNAEIKLKEFKESNRRVERSPSLKLEESRLEREVSLQTTLYMTLKSQFENVKIEEVEEAAMIEVIDGPIVPFKVTRPKKISSIIFTFIFTFLSLFFFFYLKDYNLSGSKKQSPERIEARRKLFKNIKSLIPFIQK
jgi:capsule polysaccharide export protein KpsE/RkpR